MDYSKIILELLARIQNLEQEIANLKKLNYDNTNVSPQQDIDLPRTRDTSRYMFNGAVYPKNRLVLAVVHEYIKNHPKISKSELKQVFEKSVQGSIGVVEDSEVAQQRADYSVRFFSKEEELLELIDGKMFVCSQWGILNIPNFLKRAEQLGFEIETI